MHLKCAFKLVAVSLFLLGTKAQAREVEVASGSQCIDAVKIVQKAYEQKSGNSVKHFFEDGLTFPSVILALDSGKAELAVIAFTWPEAQKQIEEKKINVKNLDKIVSFPIGSIRQVFFTNMVGPESLSEEQIGKILSGAAHNWRDLGGSDYPIVVASQANTSTTQGLLSKRFLKGEPLNKKDWKSFPTYGEVIKFVASKKGAFAFGPDSSELKVVRVPKQPEVIRSIVGLTVGPPTPEAREIIRMAAEAASAK